jgi:phosphonate transport system substrate-binding protein
VDTLYKLSYYPWLTQNVPAQQVHDQIVIFAQAISQELTRLGAAPAKVEVLPPLDVPEQIAQIVAKGADIALMNPLGFVFANRQSQDVDAIAVAQRIIDGVIGVEYFGQLYARKDRKITNLVDAAGKAIGYGTPVSTSNFLMPARLLKEAGIHPLLGFGRIEFLKGHEIVARAVYSGRVDIGAGHDGVIVDLARQPGFTDAETVLKQIARTPPIPSDPVVVSIRDATEKKILQKAIVAASSSTPGAAALKIFWGNTQGLQATTSDPYRVLLTALEELKLDQEDILLNARN